MNPQRTPIRAGMIGLDTSHVPAFTGIFNDPDATGDVATVKVVAGYPGGSDLALSRDRLGKFTEHIRARGVQIVESIPQLLELVDVVMIESVDGRLHWPQAIPAILAGKPLWIDKPVAGSLADAIAIYDLARQHKVPVFSSSSLRFGEVQTLKQSEDLGAILGAATWGTCTYLEGTPDLFFYGIHAIELLFALMGPGCESVSRVQAASADFVTGVWQGGRVGTYRGIHQGSSSWGALVYGANAIKPVEKLATYDDLCAEIARFFLAGKAPVAPAETLEIVAFMEAADESKRRGGNPVLLSELMAKATDEAATKLQSAALSGGQ